MDCPPSSLYFKKITQKTVSGGFYFVQIIVPPKSDVFDHNSDWVTSPSPEFHWLQ